MSDGAAAAGQQIVGILQKMMKEVTETIQQASEQLGQVEVRAGDYLERAIICPLLQYHSRGSERSLPCRARQTYHCSRPWAQAVEARARRRGQRNPSEIRTNRSTSASPGQAAPDNALLAPQESAIGLSGVDENGAPGNH